MKRKKGSSGSNKMILLHSNVSKYFKKQHTNTVYCFASRHSLGENSNNTNESFLKKAEAASFIGKLFLLTTIEGQPKACVNINREYFFKSYK